MEIIELALKMAVLITGGAIAIKFLAAALSLALRSSKLDYESNRAKSSSPSKALTGRLSTYRNGYRNKNFSAGFVADTRKKSVELNGKLSDESIARVLPERILN